LVVRPARLPGIFANGNARAESRSSTSWHRLKGAGLRCGGRVLGNQRWGAYARKANGTVGKVGIAVGGRKARSWSPAIRRLQAFDRAALSGQSWLDRPLRGSREVSGKRGLAVQRAGEEEGRTSGSEQSEWTSVDRRGPCARSFGKRFEGFMLGAAAARMGRRRQGRRSKWFA
jgi:hypothetical protein